MDLTAHYDPTREAYQAALRVDSLEPVHFMPLDSLYSLTASLQVEGKGTDPFAAQTWAKIEGAVNDIRYGLTSVSDVRLKGSLEQHALQMELVSGYPLAKFDLSLNGELKQKDVKAMLIADVEHLDLHEMHLLSNPFATSFQLFAEAESDLEERNLLDVTLGNWEVVTPRKTFHPKTLTLHTRTDSDTTRVSFHAGDLGIVLTGNACVHEMTDKLQKVSDELNRQVLRDSTVNLQLLRPLLPELLLEVHAGEDNRINN